MVKTLPSGWYYCWYKGDPKPLLRWFHENLSYACDPNSVSGRDYGVYSQDKDAMLLMGAIEMYDLVIKLELPLWPGENG